MLFSCISASCVWYIRPNRCWVFTHFRGVLGFSCLLWPYLKDPTVGGVGQTQPKICDQEETRLPHSNIEEGNVLVWSVCTAACVLPALFPVPGGIQVYSYFLSNRSCGEKSGCLHAPSPAPSPVPFHMELLVALGTEGAPSSLWEDDRLGVISAKGTPGLEEGTSSKC